MMTDNNSFWETLMQLFQQSAQRLLLFRCPGVRSLTRCIQTTLIANPDAMCVMPNDMRPNHFQGPTRLYRAVAPYNIMVPAPVLPASGPVPSVDVLNTAPLPRTDSRAMYDQ